MENMELDLVVFEDENDNEITMEVLDYLAYEGKQYALLAEYDAESEAENNDGVREAIVMEIVGVEGDEEMEEFVPVDDKLAEKLLDIFENNLFEEDDLDDFDDVDDD